MMWRTRRCHVCQHPVSQWTGKCYLWSCPENPDSTVKRQPTSSPFWNGVKKSAESMKDAPDWMKGGITLNPQHFETYAAPRSCQYCCVAFTEKSPAICSNPYCWASKSINVGYVGYLPERKLEPVTIGKECCDEAVDRKPCKHKSGIVINPPPPWVCEFCLHPMWALTPSAERDASVVFCQCWTKEKDMSYGKSVLTVDLTCIVTKANNTEQCIAECPEMNIAVVGRSPEDAKRALRLAVVKTLEEKTR